MKLIVATMIKKQEDLKAENKLDSFPFSLNIIYCTPRSISKKLMQKELSDCIDLKEKFPDLICGK
jgi:adenosine deaminase CECR1